jgi:hypothetical protein
MIMRTTPSRTRRLVDVRRRKRAHSGKLEFVIHYGRNGDDLYEINHAGFPLTLLIDRQGGLDLRKLLDEAIERSTEADDRGDSARMYERVERLTP